MNPDASNTIFQKAVAFVNNTNRHLFLTGKAGTGKTTFLKYIKENTFKKLAIVAPTGVAAINAGGVTIHSFFQLPFGPFLPTANSFNGIYNGEINNRTTLLKNLKLRGEKRQIIQELDLLVIDEISMVRADLLDAIDTVMRHIRKQPLLPFGGVQMVYIGDLFQLPPVVKYEEWDILQQHYRSPFFFDAQALQFAPPVFIELKKIYRQKDDAFINLLNNIRNNCCSNQDFALLQEYYNPEFIPSKTDNYITLTSHNSKADIINERELAKLPGKLHKYPAKVTGEFYERSYPAEKEILLKEGAQVMFIKNDKGENRRFYNGKIGTIKKISSDKIVVNLANNEEVELEIETWKNINYQYNNEKDKLDEEELGTFSQYPVRLAWAITIHKSQGLTFEKAVIDAGASFAPGQVYVSLSRLTSLQGLVLKSKILPGSISTDTRVVDFVRSEMDEAVLQQTLESEQKVFIRQSLLRSFEWNKMADAVNTHFEEYEHRIIPKKDECIEWGKRLCESAGKQSDISDKFIKKMQYLFLTCEQDGYEKLRERTLAATEYFLDELDTNLLKPVKQHIEEVKVRQKVKKYVKELQHLLLLFSRKKQQLLQAKELANALYKSVAVTELLEMVHSKARPASETEASLNKPAQKPEKGESARISLQLFKQGKTIADIAAERGFSVSTIEGHLANFITTGEIDILDLVDETTLNKLIAITDAEPELSYSAIKDKAGDVSYSSIKAVLNYNEYLKSTSSKEVQP